MERKEAPYEAECIFCHQWVVDGRKESGYTGLGTDWMTHDGDFGCDLNPITNEDGCGGHWTLYDATGLYVVTEWQAERNHARVWPTQWQPSIRRVTWAGVSSTERSVIE